MQNNSLHMYTQKSKQLCQEGKQCCVVDVTCAVLLTLYVYYVLHASENTRLTLSKCYARGHHLHVDAHVCVLICRGLVTELHSPE